MSGMEGLKNTEIVNRWIQMAERHAAQSPALRERHHYSMLVRLWRVQCRPSRKKSKNDLLTREFGF